MSFKELAAKNRSFRGYDESFTFTKEDLAELVEYTRLCAAAGNRQVLKYRVSWEKPELDAMKESTLLGATMRKRGVDLPLPGKHPTGYITICIDTDIVENIKDWFYMDIGIAAQTMLLAAAEKGLGGCMIANFNPDKVRTVLDLPENLQPKLVICLGRPAEKVVLTDTPEPGAIDYWRDAEDTHFVPKRPLSEILL